MDAAPSNEDRLVNRYLTGYARDRLDEELARVEAAEPSTSADVGDEEWREQREQHIAALHEFVGAVRYYATSKLPPSDVSGPVGPATESELVVLLVCSFRYALGRRSYIVSEVADSLIRHREVLPEHLRAQIWGEIDAAVATRTAGMDCDVQAWQRVAQAMRADADADVAETLSTATPTDADLDAARLAGPHTLDCPALGEDPDGIEDCTCEPTIRREVDR